MGALTSREGREDLVEELRERLGFTKKINPARVRNSAHLHYQVPYEWRLKTLASSSYDSADEVQGRNLDPEELRRRVTACLASPAFRSKPPQGPKQYLVWMQKRVDALEKTGGPRMRVVWWRTLKELGRIPRWPDDKAHIIDLKLLLDVWLKNCDRQGRMDDRYLYIWMLSHRWERPHFCEQCLTGHCEQAAYANPDSLTNIKARTIAKWGENQHDMVNVGPMSPEDYYIWIDFGSIDQSDNMQKAMGIEMLPLYVACCSSGLVMFLPSGEIQYEERAWTSIERVLAYTYGVSPVLKKIDSGYIKGSPYWNAKKLCGNKPEYWQHNNHGTLCMSMRDPLKGQLTCKEDVEKIEHLKQVCKSAPPIDFYDTKGSLMFDETLFRVEDTCIERATVTSRAPRNQRYTNTNGQADVEVDLQDGNSRKSRFSLMPGGGGAAGRVAGSILGSLRPPKQKGSMLTPIGKTNSGDSTGSAQLGKKGLSAENLPRKKRCCWCCCSRRKANKTPLPITDTFNGVTDVIETPKPRKTKKTGARVSIQESTKSGVSFGASEDKKKPTFDEVSILPMCEEGDEEEDESDDEGQGSSPSKRLDKKILDRRDSGRYTDNKAERPMKVTARSSEGAGVSLLRAIQDGETENLSVCFGSATVENEESTDVQSWKMERKDLVKRSSDTRKRGSGIAGNILKKSTADQDDSEEECDISDIADLEPRRSDRSSSGGCGAGSQSIDVAQVFKMRSSQTEEDHDEEDAHSHAPELDTVAVDDINDEPMLLPPGLLPNESADSDGSPRAKQDLSTPAPDEEAI